MVRQTIFRAAIPLAIAAATCGCKWPAEGGAEKPPPPPVGLWQAGPDPVAGEKAKQYPEAAGGQFITLADFEDRPGGISGRQQVGYFQIEPADPKNRLSFSQGGRTGNGGLSVSIQPGCRLVMLIHADRDIFTGKSLLELAMDSPTYRDDLRIALVSGKGKRISPPVLLTPGWNDVSLDITRLAAPGEDFDPAKVTQLVLSFDRDEPFDGRLDDILLVDNRRRISPVPAGWTVEKKGLDYSIVSSDGQLKLSTVRDSDGLWRLGVNQSLLSITPPGQPQQELAERLDLLGSRRLGNFILTETNSLRVRFRSMWYFPSSAKLWASMAVNYVSWDYTLYRDGRLVTTLEVNGSSGQPLGPVSIKPPGRAAWAGGNIADTFTQKDMVLPVERWSFLQAEGELSEDYLREYCQPGDIEPLFAALGIYAPGDLDRDGFDESQGCYFLAGVGGLCRIVVKPPKGGLHNPVFRIALGATKSADVNLEGLPVRDQTILPDGSVLFVVPGLIDRPMLLEALALPE